MPSLLESIAGQLGGDFMKQLGGALGTDERTAGAATAAALPTLLGAISRNASRPEGAAALAGALDRDHDGSVLDDLTGLLQNPGAAGGDGILGHVLGGRRAAVENGLGQATGLDAAKVGQLLAVLAPVVLGAIGRRQRQQGLDPSGLAGLLGNERAAIEREQPAAAGILGSLLDADGDGDVDLSDLAKRGAGLLGKFLGK
jgi:hypothetical protein